MTTKSVINGPPVDIDRKFEIYFGVLYSWSQPITDSQTTPNVPRPILTINDCRRLDKADINISRSQKLLKKIQNLFRNHKTHDNIPTRIDLKLIQVTNSAQWRYRANVEKFWYFNNNV